MKPSADSDAGGIEAITKVILPRPKDLFLARPILIIDDDLSIRQLLTTQLQLLKYTAATAGTGLEAIEHLTDQPETDRHDWVLLLDIAMPGSDGVATCRLLRKQGFKGRILAHTGKDSFETRLRCSEAGFDGYLVKPVDIESLHIAIESLFETDHREAKAA